MEYEFDSMFFFLSAFATVLTLLLSLAIFRYSSRKTKELIVLFIDAPDPDNPAAAAALYKHNKTVHVVLTGRPADLKTPKNKPHKLDSDPGIVRQEWEINEPLHAHKLQEDSAARIHDYLIKCNVEANDIAIYDGGIAPIAPLSDVVHDWDFLFDRKDLISAQPGDQGVVLTPEEYRSLVTTFSDLSVEEREQKLLSILRPYSLRPLAHLRKQVESKSCSNVVIFLGGPATAVVRLFNKSKTSVLRKVSSIYGMFGSLNPGKATLLPNQFNVACDIEAACSLFIDNILPHTEKYLITTETAKNEVFMLSSIDLHKVGVPSYFVDLQRLWESTHKHQAQPMFDVLPVMACMNQFKGCFKWRKKKAVLYEWQRRGGGGSTTRQVFSFVDSEDDNKCVFVSDSSVEHLDKALFLDFMHRVWTQQ